MSVEDLPPGEWTEILIGDHWPNHASVAAITSGVDARTKTALDFELYSSLLGKIKSSDLAHQEGVTAEHSRASFALGAINAEQIAHINGVKRDAYQAVQYGVVELRGVLHELASEGNAQIEEVNKSQKLLPQKISEILAIALEIRALAFQKSADCVGNIAHQVRTVLTAQGIGTSSKDFGAQLGAYMTTRRPNEAVELRNEISDKLVALERRFAEGAGTIASTNSLANSGSHFKEPVTIGGRPATAIVSSTTTEFDGENGLPRTTSAPATTSGPPSTEAIAASGRPSTMPVAPTNAPMTTEAIAASGSPMSATLSASWQPPGVSLQPAMNTSNGSLGAGNSRAPSLTTPDAAIPQISPNLEPPLTSSAVSTGNPVGASALAPNELAQSLDTGIRTGAPVSAGAEAIATAVVTPVHTAPPPLSTSLETITPAPTVFETAHAVSSQGHELAHVGPVSADVAPPVIAPAPPAAVAPVIAPPVSAGPVAMPSPTPLIAYGADLRPPAVAAAAAPPVNVAAPGSAPINPSGSAAPTGQPTVVRQQHSAATPLAVAAGLTERAVAAATGGAAVGAAAARTEAENRLRRLLAAVARQQPQLRWAIGILDNGDTVLATDLAGGWLPPHIDVPVGVKLLQPAAHRRNLAALLGAATLTAHYEPGQYLSPAAEPVAMSIRGRDTTAVEDLGWALSQATKWRDGLPRLAHTLAKAITAQTGFLDSEVVLLREHLRAVERTVLVKYPANVNPAEVANWQLLATIAALLDNDRRLANYHFDWFQTQALPRGGYR